MQGSHAARLGACDIALLIVHEDANTRVERKLVEYHLVGAGVWLQDLGIGRIEDGMESIEQTQFFVKAGAVKQVKLVRQDREPAASICDQSNAAVRFGPDHTRGGGAPGP